MQCILHSQLYYIRIANGKANPVEVYLSISLAQLITEKKKREIQPTYNYMVGASTFSGRRILAVPCPYFKYGLAAWTTDTFTSIK